MSHWTPEALSDGPESDSATASSAEIFPIPTVRRNQMGFLVRSVSYSLIRAGSFWTTFSTRFSQPGGGSSARPPTRKKLVIIR